jgi:hypothetical protein
MQREEEEEEDERQAYFTFATLAWLAARASAFAWDFDAQKVPVAWTSSATRRREQRRGEDTHPGCGPDPLEVGALLFQEEKQLRCALLHGVDECFFIYLHRTSQCHGPVVARAARNDTTIRPTELRH